MGDTEKRWREVVGVGVREKVRITCEGNCVDGAVLGKFDAIHIAEVMSKCRRQGLSVSFVDSLVDLTKEDRTDAAEASGHFDGQVHGRPDAVDGGTEGEREDDKRKRNTERTHVRFVDAVGVGKTVFAMQQQAPVMKGF